MEFQPPCIHLNELSSFISNVFEIHNMFNKKQNQQDSTKITLQQIKQHVPHAWGGRTGWLDLSVVIWPNSR